ncbi:DUF2062 domain-containing protein [Acuticoccus sp. MNP-M23]|uniref:DUF2062 domain-containing protein n=1 Tax=Acuticoccus sp. MNP-M23 TaxID=3072793 RepID=UPI00281691E6|nr:DUF2062 domain-containing protein [Acuticoccus sp. MNP-M23]WMS43396.1 DUF2062 domain-containing protein [Acuticoccus sp. MNP-M23]
MLFGRRGSPGLIERFRLALWPRRSFPRSFRYYKARVLRLEASPHAIAAGVAVGAFASCTPLIGFHFLLAFFFAWIVGGSMLAAAFGTAVGNPLTFPLIWVSSFQIGELILGRAPGAMSPLHIEWSLGLITSSFGTLWPTLKPMFVGGAIIGLILAVTLYVLVRSAVVVSHRVRAERLAASRERAAAAALAKAADTMAEDGDDDEARKEA